MVVETHEDATLVPTAAIQRGAPGTFVFLVKEDKTVAVTPVQLGAVSGETSEVSKGLAPGNLVVVDGADKLRDGAHINLQQDGQTQAPAQTAPQASAPAPAGTAPQPQTQPPDQPVSSTLKPDDTGRHKGQGRKHRHAESGQQQ